MKFKNLFEQSSAVEIVIDRSFTIATATNAFLEATGESREDIISKHIFDAFPDYTTLYKDEISVAAAIHDVIKNKTVTTLPVVRYDIFHEEDSEDGEVKYWQLNISPITGDDGDVEFISLRSVDVTEHELARIEIKDSNERYQRMLMESPYAVSVLKGEDMVVALANDLAKERLGIKEDVVGKTLLEVLPELKNQPYLEILRNVYRTGEAFSASETLAQIKREDGSLENRYFDVNFQPYREADDTISGVTSISYEVTDLVRARRQVEKSENRYRLLIEESPIATALYTGPDIVVHYANDIMLEYWDVDKSVIGMPLTEIIPEIEEQNFVEYLKEVFKSGDSYTGDEERTELYKNGELQTFYFNFTYKALRDNEGNVYGIHHTAIDVTDKVLAKKALEENEKALRQLLDSMPQKISHTDSDGNVIFFNRQWTDETGYAPEELTGNKWITLIHPDDVRNLKEKWISSIRAEVPFEVECRIWNKDLGYRWNLNRAVPIKDDDGDILMWVGSNTDIHDQKTQKEMLEKAVQERTKELEQANQELIIQNREIEKQRIELLSANRELESFAYISSHDLQEPLRKIQTFADRIRDKEKKNLSAKGYNYFERMEDAADRMRNLIDDLLTFSRVNSADYNFEKINLNIILDKVKEDYREEIEEKNATIEVDDLCDANVIEFQFRQLMNNLVSNSLKFSKPGTPPHIRIKNKIVCGNDLDIPHISPDKKYCQINVEDNGIGFEPNYSEKIFEVFQRLHNRDVYEGTGIGLAIVKKIVDNHDGHITAHSAPGAGTEIIIYIPAY